MDPDELMTVTQAARAIGTDPPKVSRAIYAGATNEDFTPMLGNRRLVKKVYLPELQRIMRRRGSLHADAPDLSKVG